MDREYLEELLTWVKNGELPVEKALEALRDFPNAIAAYVGEAVEGGQEQVPWSKQTLMI